MIILFAICLVAGLYLIYLGAFALINGYKKLRKDRFYFEMELVVFITTTGAGIALIKLSFYILQKVFS